MNSTSSKKWILPTTWGSLEADPPLEKPEDEMNLTSWFQTCKTQLSCAQTSDLQKSGENKWVFF